MDLERDCCNSESFYNNPIVAYYDHETDECLSVAVLYYKQGYIIVYQKEGFEINGILDRCANCDQEDEHRESWSGLEDGLWHCRWCGTITKIPEDRTEGVQRGCAFN